MFALLVGLLVLQDCLLFLLLLAALDVPWTIVASVAVIMMIILAVLARRNAGAQGGELDLDQLLQSVDVQTESEPDG